MLSCRYFGCPSAPSYNVPHLRRPLGFSLRWTASCGRHAAFDQWMKYCKCPASSYAAAESESGRYGDLQNDEMRGKRADDGMTRDRCCGTEQLVVTR
jgi:hypothetical protein